jgi:hypothetical protein
VELYGKALLASPDNAANWAYLPSALSLASAYEYATAETSRSRVLTKITAAAFAKFYGKHAPALLSITRAQSLAAESVIASYATYARQETFRAAMFARLSQFAECLIDAEPDCLALVELEECELPLTDVLAALINAFDVKVVDSTITADAL